MSALALLLAAFAGSADAQSALLASSPTGGSLPAAGVAARPSGVELLSESARASLPVRQGSASSRPGRVVFGLMGGLIGAGTGFLVSQIVHDDWEKTSNSTFASHRRSFALSGAAVGVVAAVLLDRAAPTVTGIPIRSGAADRGGSGGAITQVELAEFAGRTAHDVVAALRPQWLITRGETLGSLGTIIGDTDAPGPGAVATVAGDERIGVFLDAIMLEGLASLREIPVSTISRIEFRTGSVSSTPGGPGHVQRAIVVISADGRGQ